MLPTVGRDYRPASREDHYAKLQAFVDRFKGLPPGKYDYRHYFSDNTYIRELRLKKGTLVVGAIHLKETAMILMKGSMKIYSEEGLRIVKAPQVIISPVGTQRAGYALEDTVLATIHSTNTWDLEETVKQLAIGELDTLSGVTEGDYKLYIHGRKVIDEKIQSISDKSNLKRNIQRFLPAKS